MNLPDGLIAIGIFSLRNLTGQGKKRNTTGVPLSDIFAKAAITLKALKTFKEIEKKLNSIIISVCYYSFCPKRQLLF